MFIKSDWFWLHFCSMYLWVFLFQVAEELQHTSGRETSPARVQKLWARIALKHFDLLNPHIPQIKSKVLWHIMKH